MLYLSKLLNTICYQFDSNVLCDELLCGIAVSSNPDGIYFQELHEASNSAWR